MTCSGFSQTPSGQQSPSAQFTPFSPQLFSLSHTLLVQHSSTWLSVKEVMIVTGLSRSTINRAIQKGELVSVMKGGKRMIKRDWIDKWIQG